MSDQFFTATPDGSGQKIDEEQETVGANDLVRPRIVGAERKTYSCNTGPITGATATGTKSLTYLWHPSTDTDRVRLLGCFVNQIAGAAGAMRLELARITAENGTPGGSTGTIMAHNQADAASSQTVRIAPTGAPTRASGRYFGANVPVGLDGDSLYPPFVDPKGFNTKPLILRESTNEGYELIQEVTSTITTAPVFNITWVWEEII